MAFTTEFQNHERETLSGDLHPKNEAELPIEFSQPGLQQIKLEVLQEADVVEEVLLENKIKNNAIHKRH